MPEKLSFGEDFFPEDVAGEDLMNTELSEEHFLLVWKRPRKLIE